MHGREIPVPQIKICGKNIFHNSEVNIINKY